MIVDAPSGTLEITDEALVFRPADDGAETRVSLKPVPDFFYERSIYGDGALSIGGEAIPLREQDAGSVVEELARLKSSSTQGKAGKSRQLSDADKASASEAGS